MPLRERPVWWPVGEPWPNPKAIKAEDLNPKARARISRQRAGRKYMEQWVADEKKMGDAGKEGA